MNKDKELVVIPIRRSLARAFVPTTGHNTFSFPLASHGDACVEDYGRLSDEQVDDVVSSLGRIASEGLPEPACVLIPLGDKLLEFSPTWVRVEKLRREETRS